MLVIGLPTPRRSGQLYIRAINLTEQINIKACCFRIEFRKRDLYLKTRRFESVGLLKKTYTVRVIIHQRGSLKDLFLLLAVRLISVERDCVWRCVPVVNKWQASSKKEIAFQLTQSLFRIKTTECRSAWAENLVIQNIAHLSVAKSHYIFKTRTKLIAYLFCKDKQFAAETNILYSKNNWAK